MVGAGCSAQRSRFSSWFEAMCLLIRRLLASTSSLVFWLLGAGGFVYAWILAKYFLIRSSSGVILWFSTGMPLLFM